MAAEGQGRFRGPFGKQTEGCFWLSREHSADPSAVPGSQPTAAAVPRGLLPGEQKRTRGWEGGLSADGGKEGGKGDFLASPHLMHVC